MKSYFEKDAKKSLATFRRRVQKKNLQNVRTNSRNLPLLHPILSDNQRHEKLVRDLASTVWIVIYIFIYSAEIHEH